MLVLWTLSHGFQTVRYQALLVTSSAFSFKWHKNIAQSCVGMFFSQKAATGVIDLQKRAYARHHFGLQAGHSLCTQKRKTCVGML